MGLAIGVTQPAMFSVLGAKISKDIQGLIVGLRTSSNRCATFLIPLFAGLDCGNHQYPVDILDRRDDIDGFDAGDLVDRQRSPVIVPYTGYIEPITKFDSRFW